MAEKVDARGVVTLCGQLREQLGGFLAQDVQVERIIGTAVERVRSALVKSLLVGRHHSAAVGKVK